MTQFSPLGQCVQPNSQSSWDTDSQTLRATFIATTAGTYQLRVLLGSSETGSVEMTDNQYSMNVIPAIGCQQMDASSCDVKRTNLQTLGSEPGVVYAGISPINVLSFRVVDVFGNVRHNNDTVDIGLATNAAVIATSSPAQGGVPATGLS